MGIDGESRNCKMYTTKMYRLIAVVCWMQFTMASDCPPERMGLPRFPTRRLDGSLTYSRLPSGLADLQIVGGTEVTANEFPFLISLQKKISGSDTDYYHLCGGSIYSERFIITAAHCVPGATASDLRIVAGEHNLQAASGDEQVITVQTINSHPDYNSGTYDNDIAILELNSALTFNDKVGRITMNTVDPSAGTDVTVAGWGTLSSGGSSPDIMNKVTVDVISNTQCSVNYNTQGYTITDNMICAGVTEGGKDSCQGDSGGPLFMVKTSTRQRPKTWWLFTTTTQAPTPSPTTAPTPAPTTAPTPAPTPAPNVEYEQVGIVSWGIGCANQNFPGVYARISKYISYIVGIAGAQS